MWSALKYFVQEAWVSLVRGRRSSIFSVITIATALFVLGAFLLVSSNLERLLAAWSSAAEISVYLRDDISSDDRAAAERAARDSAIVEAHEYVSKQEALNRFKREFADLATIAGSFAQNPFPASFEVRVRSGPGRSEAIEELATQLARMKGVADVRYDRRWMDRLLVAVSLVRGIGLVLAGVLIVAAALTVANVVRLACHARRDEVEIAKLVGAPLSYVRGPFVVEGILQGGAGALIALAVLWVVFLIARARYARIASDLVDISAARFLPVELCGWLLLGGMAVGCLGGFIGARSAEDRSV